MKPLAPNTLLQNRYLVVHLIGKGGMGEVYLAVDQRLGSAVALKRTLHGEDAALGDAFEREARTLARLRHPALPKVSDHFIENGNQFLVMEHISGDDLAKRLTATQKPFPLSWVLFWADQLLDALAYLHSHEPPIIHRDIKPQNLKLTDDNNIVLLDFGLSKNSTGQTNLASGSGSTGSVVGYTPHYAPMEQIRGTGTNPRSDIYSLSATLYQLLTNVVPPDALSRADFLLSGKPDPIAPIDDVNPEIPKSISDVVLKGMSISQDQRFTDAREMQRVLRETYARMQSGMAENTVAFNASEQTAEPEQAPPAMQTNAFSADRTEQFSAPVGGEQSALKEAMGAQTIPFGMIDGDAALENPATVAQAVESAASTPPNFDATVRMDDISEDVPGAHQGLKTEVLPADESSAPKQSAVRTEVLGGDFGAAEYLQSGDAPSSSPATNDYGAQTDESVATPATPNFTGDKTVPLVDFENQPSPIDLAQTQPASAFDSVPQAENYATRIDSQPPTGAEVAAPTNGQYYQQASPDYDSQPQAAPPSTTRPKPAKKSSKGLVFGVLGAFFGLFVLAALGGAAYWYFVMRPSTAVVTPTPTPAATAAPTPETTPEQALTDPDAGNTTAGTETGTNDNTADNSILPPTPAPTRPTVTPQTPAQQQQQQQQQQTRPTVTPRQTTTKPPPTPRATTETKPTLRGREIPQ